MKYLEELEKIEKLEQEFYEPCNEAIAVIKKAGQQPVNNENLDNQIGWILLAFKKLYSLKNKYEDKNPDGFAQYFAKKLGPEEHKALLNLKNLNVSESDRKLIENLRESINLDDILNNIDENNAPNFDDKDIDADENLQRDAVKYFTIWHKIKDEGVNRKFRDLIRLSTNLNQIDNSNIEASHINLLSVWDSIQKDFFTGSALAADDLVPIFIGLAHHQKLSEVEIESILESLSNWHQNTYLQQTTFRIAADIARERTPEIYYIIITIYSGFLGARNQGLIEGNQHLSEELENIYNDEMCHARRDSWKKEISKKILDCSTLITQQLPTFFLGNNPQLENRIFKQIKDSNAWLKSNLNHFSLLGTGHNVILEVLEYSQIKNSLSDDDKALLCDIVRYTNDLMQYQDIEGGFVGFLNSQAGTNWFNGFSNLINEVESKAFREESCATRNKVLGALGILLGTLLILSVAFLCAMVFPPALAVAGVLTVSNFAIPLSILLPALTAVATISFTAVGTLMTVKGGQSIREGEYASNKANFWNKVKEDMNSLKEEVRPNLGQNAV